MHPLADGNIDADKRTDPKKLEAAMHEVFKAVPSFCNFHQLKQFSIRFGEQWGFQVATHVLWHLMHGNSYVALPLQQNKHVFLRFPLAKLETCALTGATVRLRS
jgi:hypothetical protein